MLKILLVIVLFIIASSIYKNYESNGMKILNILMFVGMILVIGPKNLIILAVIGAVMSAVFAK